MKKITFLAVVLTSAFSFGQVLNGDFASSDLTGNWDKGNTAKWDASSGVAVNAAGSSTAGSSRRLAQEVGTFEIGTTYKITFKYTVEDASNSDSNIAVNVGPTEASNSTFDDVFTQSFDNSGGNVTTLTETTVTFDATAEMHTVSFTKNNGSTNTVSVDDIEIRNNDTDALLFVNGYTVKDVIKNAVVYYNLHGQEVANPVVGEAYIVKYKVGNKYATDKIMYVE